MTPDTSDIARFTALNQKLSSGGTLSSSESDELKGLISKQSKPGNMDAIPLPTASDYQKAKSDAAAAPNPATAPAGVAGRYLGPGSDTGSNPPIKAQEGGLGDYNRLAAVGADRSPVDAVSMASPSIAEPLPSSISAPDPSKFGGAPIVSAPGPAPAVDQESESSTARVSPANLPPYDTKPSADPVSKAVESSIDWNKIGAVAKKLGVGVLSLVNAYAVGRAGHGTTPEYIRQAQLAEAQKNRDLDLKRQENQNTFTSKLAGEQAKYAMSQAAAQHGYDINNLTQQQANDLAKIAAQGDITKETAYIQWYGSMNSPGRAPSVTGMYGSAGGK